MAAARLRRLWLWAPELTLLLLGIALRVTMVTRYDPEWGFDWESHWKTIKWFLGHAWELPGPFYSRTSYHPPFYYWLVARLVPRGGSLSSIASITAVAGVLRLLLLEAGLLLFFPGPQRRLQRCFALAIAVVLPASVHLDGMATNEGLLALLASLAMLLAVLALREERPRRAWLWGACGLVLALALLTKISAIAVMGTIGVAVLVDAVWKAATFRSRVRRVAPSLIAVAVVALGTGWYFARNLREFGRPVLTGFDGAESWAKKQYEDIPLWKRRTVGYVVGWDTDVYRAPTWPSGYKPAPHFFPVLIATTFADYYGYGFAPVSPVQSDGHRRPDATAFSLSRYSVAAGTLVAALVTVAWLVAIRTVWRRRRSDELAMLLLPLCAVLGQLWFCWKYPLDWEGPIKGSYVQFAAGPLCALFGVGVEWLWRRGWPGRAGVAAASAALAVIAVYCFYCRFWSPLLP